MTRLRGLIWIVGLAALVLAACQLRPAAPTPLPPTATVALPSDTPPPPDTPTPRPPTPTPPATETLAAPAPATPDPNLGVGEVVYADPLDGKSGWGWSYAEPDVVTFSTAGGQLDAVMLQANVGPRFSVSPDTVGVGDQQLRVKLVANLCYERDEYGVVFRAVSSDSRGNPNGYIFKLTCGGLVRFEALQAGQTNVIVDWTASPSIVSGAPAENQLMIWMAKDQFHFYVNERHLFSATDRTYAAGFYAFYLRDRTNGGESVSFSGLEARSILLP